MPEVPYLSNAHASTVSSTRGRAAASSQAKHHCQLLSLPSLKAATRVRQQAWMLQESAQVPRQHAAGKMAVSAQQSPWAPQAEQGEDMCLTLICCSCLPSDVTSRWTCPRAAARHCAASRLGL